MCLCVWVFCLAQIMHAAPACLMGWIPGTGVTHSCELSCRCWELNPASLEGQTVLLTVELSLQPPGGDHGSRVNSTLLDPGEEITSGTRSQDNF